MTVYRYRAVNPAGEVAVGELDAANESEIVDRLRDQGLMPMQIAHATAGGSAAASAAPARDGRRRRWFESKIVTRDQVLAITRELATLLRAGLTLDRALEILIGLAPTPAVAGLLQNVRDDVRGGKALSQALDARREIFSRFYVNIVRAGEAGGALAEVLQRLADTMERNKELRESVKSALVAAHTWVAAPCSGDRTSSLLKSRSRATSRCSGNAATAATSSRFMWRASLVATMPGCTANARMPEPLPRRSSSTACNTLAVFAAPYARNLS